MLQRFRLLDANREVALAQGCRRLLAVLALKAAGARRDLVAGLFWPDVSESCARSCLRTSLARVARAAPFVVRATADDLSLADYVAIDLRDGQDLAERLLQRGELTDVDAASKRLHLLAADLLPGWYEDWVVVEAERWRQLRLHALEALADALRQQRRFGEASAAAAAAIAGDSLRETARIAMIRIHLAEGNPSEALREFEQYRSVVRRDVGKEPSEQLRQLLPAA